MHTHHDSHPASTGKSIRSFAAGLGLNLILACAAPLAAAQPAALPSRNAPQDLAPLPARGATPSQLPQQGQQPAQNREQTKVVSDEAYERLINNKGINLQWLWTDRRGTLKAVDDNGLIRIQGGNTQDGGSLQIKGDILSVSMESLTFRGTILILDAPDKGRRCERTGTFEFRASGKRQYWRLQQMQTCDRLTDYVDIYF